MLNTALICLGFVIGFIFATAWCIFVKAVKIEHWARRGGYHFHHTLFILPMSTLALLASGKLSLFFFSFGVGIVSHDVYFEKKLNFITRE